MDVDYSGLPAALRAGARRWIEHGVEPGDFLRAVICNDLREAFARADDRNIVLLRDIVRWWYNEAPAACWGSSDRFDQWRAAKSSPVKAAKNWTDEEAGTS